MYWTIVLKNSLRYDHGHAVWQSELKTMWTSAQWKKIRLNVFKLTTSTKLRYFQYRILSKKLVTNVTRSKWDKSISGKCHFCQEGKENILHLMWECTVIKNFWCKIAKWLNYICKYSTKFDATMIITNQCMEENGEFIEMLILMAKQYIYACKCLNQDIKISTLMFKLHEYYITEKLIAQQNCKMYKFQRKWRIYDTYVI